MYEILNDISIKKKSWITIFDLPSALVPSEQRAHDSSYSWWTHGMRHH
jgi:hypothetical protein